MSLLFYAPKTKHQLKALITDNWLSDPKEIQLAYLADIALDVHVLEGLMV